MSDYYVKRSNTLPGISVALSDSAGAALDLTNVDTVQLRARPQLGTGVLLRTCTIESPPTDGIVSYACVAADWEAGQFVPGIYLVEFKLTYASGDVLTVPTIGQRTLEVTEDLA